MPCLRIAMVALVVCLALNLAGPGTATGQQSDVTLARVPHGGLQPEILTDAGIVHMVYFAGTPDGGNLFYVRSLDDGATFSPPLRVNSQDRSAIAVGTIRGAQLAIGRAGRVHVAWNGSTVAEPKAPAGAATNRPETPMLYTRLNSARDAFEPQRNLITGTTNLDGGGSIAADGDGHVYVVWHGNDARGSQDESARRVWLAHSKDDGATFATERPVWQDATGACGCCGMRLAAAAAGKLHLLYRSATAVTNRDLYVLKSDDHGATVSGRLQHAWSIGACPMTSMSMITTPSAVWGAWETNGQVLFADVNASSSREPLAPPGTPAGRKHPRLAMNNRGETLLVWTEGMAWARGGAVAWQVFDGRGVPTARAGVLPGVAVWSFAAAVARRDGGFTVFY